MQTSNLSFRCPCHFCCADRSAVARPEVAPDRPDYAVRVVPRLSARKEAPPR